MMESFHDSVYLNVLYNILRHGSNKSDRTGTGTISLPFQQMRFGLSDGSIPLLTTKKVFHKGIIRELLWFIKGDTNIKYLNDHNVHIWDDWADENGDLGPVYGAMWRAYPSEDGPIDQLANCIKELRTNPTSRRIIVESWNPGLLPDLTKSFSENVANGKQALPPCHMSFQFWSDGNKNLSMHMYQRSADMFLGVPFNIAQYSILLHIIASITKHTADTFVWTGGDCHIYNNHLDQVKEQLKRELYPSPKLYWKTNSIKEIDDFCFEDFQIIDYKCHPQIKAPISV